MKYPAARDDAIKEIMVESVALPYFYKNEDWYYYDEKLKANVIGDVPPELSMEF